MKYFLIPLSGAPEKAGEKSNDDSMEQSFAGSMTVSLSSIPSSDSRKEISSFPCSIGRGDDVTLKIKNAQVSRKHCVISKEGDTLFVEDLGSLNGTFVGGDRVSEKSALKDGDVIALGSVLLRLNVEE